MRRAYIQNQVLKIYRAMDIIEFPINVDALLFKMKNVRTMSFRSFSDATGCTIRDVETICQSQTGCTHYDRAHDRYLVLYNDECNTDGRVRWTKAHELAHIVLGHFSNLQCRNNLESDCDFFPENGVMCMNDSQIESEADSFASILLCPFPLFKDFCIDGAADIERIFGLSGKASSIAWNQYEDWRRSHRHTAWENDMRSLIRTDADSEFDLMIS